MFSTSEESVLVLRRPLNHPANRSAGGVAAQTEVPNART